MEQTEKYILNNALGLLEEIIMNSDLSPEHLWAWAKRSRSNLFQTMKDLEWWVDGGKFIEEEEEW